MTALRTPYNAFSEIQHPGGGATERAMPPRDHLSAICGPLVEPVPETGGGTVGAAVARRSALAAKSGRGEIW